jgi:predicted dehydrogenase
VFTVGAAAADSSPKDAKTSGTRDAHPSAKNAEEWGTPGTPSTPSVNPQISMSKPEVTAEEPLLAEITAFLQAVRERSRPVVSLEDGRKALALGLEILREIERHAGRIGVGRG